MTSRISDLVLRYSRVLQIVVVVVIALVFILGGREFGKRTLGICLIVGAPIQQLAGKIPYGWEGAEPSGYLTGWKALLFNTILAGIGVYLAFFPWN